MPLLFSRRFSRRLTGVRMTVTISLLVAQLLSILVEYLDYKLVCCLNLCHPRNGLSVNGSLAK